MKDDGCFGLHLARKGEPVYVSVQRERSGIDAGNLDFCLASQRIHDLSNHEFGELLRLLWTVDRILREYRPRLAAAERTKFETGVE